VTTQLQLINIIIIIIIIIIVNSERKACSTAGGSGACSINNIKTKKNIYSQLAARPSLPQLISLQPTGCPPLTATADITTAFSVTASRRSRF
jgi:hypothetical protein